MKHELLFLGKIKNSFIADGVQEYSSRLGHYTSLKITVLKEKGRAKSAASDTDAEGMLLLSAVPPGALIVALDARGKQFPSEKFAETIAGWELQGVKHVCYLIGGPEGHSAKVLQSADLLLSLSQMTFTHDMARMLLIEQLYRAYTINAGEKYHK
ncbi:MAG: hypothetical protein A2X81_11035 [Desulfobacterales bacterium GWB2_56_26]|nr:MAG: hypothetical protein A2X81_11035 [Desulfobacterales bacterium GWB2_56_26]HBG21498.1 23S rRNA (pseudouridine(1915)-N(3))-methyltransferase RlmH [Desulfobulbaceae bacterium]